MAEFHRVQPKTMKAEKVGYVHKNDGCFVLIAHRAAAGEGIGLHTICTRGVVAVKYFLQGNLIGERILVANINKSIQQYILAYISSKILSFSTRTHIRTNRRDT